MLASWGIGGGGGRFACIGGFWLLLPKFGGGPGGGGGMYGSGICSGAPSGGGGPPCACPISAACCASRASVLRHRSPSSWLKEDMLPVRVLRCRSRLLASRSAAASSSFRRRSVTCRPSLCILTLTDTGGETMLSSRLLLRLDGDPDETATAAAPPARAASPAELR